MQRIVLKLKKNEQKQEKRKKIWSFDSRSIDVVHSNNL